MKTLKTKNELFNYVHNQKVNNKNIGFVPTMGALHQGHISLVERAKSENDFVVVSIFVNPTQFNDPKDLEKYPRTIIADVEKLEKAGVDLLFYPEKEEMYFEGETWTYEPGELSRVFEGALRPGHFKGVTQIVKKLFDLVQPERAYFGQKDYQQLLIIQQMVQDFQIPITIVPCPIERESSGLAMSSRNERLSPPQRQKAAIISRTLFKIKDLAKEEKDTSILREAGLTLLREEKEITVEYLEIVDGNSLKHIQHLGMSEKQIVLIAVKLGEIRLIDNLIL